MLLSTSPRMATTSAGLTRLYPADPLWRNLSWSTRKGKIRLPGMLQIPLYQRIVGSTCLQRKWQRQKRAMIFASWLLERTSSARLRMFQRHITLVSFHLNLVENFKNIFDLAQFFLRFTVVLFSATPDFGADSNSSDVVPIIAGVLGAIFGVFLLGLLYFCFVRKRKRDSKLQHCSNTHYPPPPLPSSATVRCSFYPDPHLIPHLSPTEMAIWCLLPCLVLRPLHSARSMRFT